MARTAATTRSVATGRTAATNRSQLFNFPASLHFTPATNQYGTNVLTAPYAVTSRTLEWWQNFSVIPSATEPIFSGGGANYYFGFTADGMIVSFADASAVQRTFPVTNLGLKRNIWEHFATTVNTNGLDVTLTHYRNGASVGAATLSLGHAAAFASPFRLGLFAPSSLGPTGRIANMGFYNRALTAAEVLQRSLNLSVTSGEVSRWLFSEGSGTTVADSVGSGHWTLTNSPLWSTTCVPMKAPREIAS